MIALRSIRARLLLSGVIFTLLAVGAAVMTVKPAMDRFVQRSVDASLETQLGLLQRAVRPDGTVDTAKIDQVGPFARRGSGWAWTISGPGGVLRSQTVAQLEARMPTPEEAAAGGRPPPPPGAGPDGPKADDRHRDGRRRRFRSGATDTFYFRTTAMESARGPVTLTAGAPRYIRDRMRDEGLRPLLISLAVLGLGLLAAMLAQLELGLRPLGRLRQSLARVRAGDQSRISEPQPVELTAVVAELNALLDHNEAALARARGHVSNLAHGLKTPLATLSVRLSESGRDPDGSLAALVAQIDGAIGHHLGRARAASPGGPGMAPIHIRPRLEDLVAALARIHSDRGVTASLQAPEDLQVGCDPQDFDEMTGNLLDNAWKWAKGAVHITARRDSGMVVLAIDDDGPGLTEEAAAAALVPGRRLDEQGHGHGFGLSITQELAELYDGSLSLGRSPQGGLRVVLSLPARSGATA